MLISSAFINFSLPTFFFAHSATMPKFSTQICYCARFNFHCYNPSVRAQHRTKKSSPMPSACIVRFHLLIDYFCQSYHFIYALCLFAASSHLIFVSGSFSPLSSGWSEKSNEFFILCVCMSVFFFVCALKTQHVGFRGLFQNVVINNRYFCFFVFFFNYFGFSLRRGLSRRAIFASSRFSNPVPDRKRVLLIFVLGFFFFVKF